MPSLINAFTVDVEDYFQVSGFDSAICRSTWDSFERRVVANTSRLLDLLDGFGVKGTFFVLGWVALREPALIRRIHDAGHDIASHGFSHELVYRLTPAQFRRDVVQSRQVLEDLIGQPVIAYRAPSFSITAQTIWAFEVLAEEGFRYDASVFPVERRRYGMPSAEPGIHAISTASGTLIEFPMPVYRTRRVGIPAGGGYFRLYPYAVSRYLLNSINKDANRPFNFYVHPWEVDPDQPRVPNASFGNRFRHYINVSKTLGRLERLLKHFRFSTLQDAVEQISCPPVISLAELSRTTGGQGGPPTKFCQSQPATG